MAVVDDLSHRRRQKTRDHAGRRALARTGLAYDRDGPALMDVKGYVEEHRDLAVGGINRLHLEDRRFVLGACPLIPFVGSDGERSAVYFSCGWASIDRVLPSFDQVAVAEHHDPVRHLGDNGKIVGDVDGRGVELIHNVPDRRQDFDLGGHVEGCRRLVEDDEIGPAGHGHGGHRALKLPAGDLVRIPEADRVRVRKLEALEQIHRVAFRIRAGNDTMLNRCLAVLVDQAVSRIEGRRRRLGDIRNPVAAERPPGLCASASKLHPVEHDLTTADAAAVSRIAHGGETDRRLARAGLANQAEDLTAPQGHIDPVHDLVPGFVDTAFDLEAGHLQKDVALLAGAGGAHSFNPLETCKNQSTTKLTATVSSAIAAAGISGVMSPKVIKVALSRTMEPQSAVGG